MKYTNKMGCDTLQSNVGHKGTMTEALFGQNVWLIAAIAFFAIVVMWWFLQTFAPNLLKAINPFSSSVTDLPFR